jgi:hypothetical protein
MQQETDMQQQKIVSREYKIMLRPKLFTGAEKALLAHAHALWRGVAGKVGPVTLGTAGDLSRIKTRRLITFHDTPKRRLNEARYIFRERREEIGSVREVTLKCRHPDRFLAQAREMQAKASEAKTKFEEDIKAPFVSLYSFSTTLAVDADAAFTKLRDVLRLFPDLAKRMDGTSDAEPLRAVNNFTAREVVIDGATMQIGKTPKVNAEWALIVWYAAYGEDGKPVAVELSYRYGDKDEVYGGGVTRRASAVFDAIQSRLQRWVDPKPMTKTAFVFQ